MHCSVENQPGSKTKGPKPSQRRALIVEGGGMRGAWAIGALDALHEIGHARFDLVVAASSGACSAAYFVAGLHEPALEIWQRYIDGEKLLRKANWLHFRPMLDLAYLVDHLLRKKFPLPLHAFTNGTQFQIVLTDCLTGTPVYFPARDERMFEALRASASIPFATRGYWLVDGKPYADGAIGDPIPIAHVLREGATDITVILTHRSDHQIEAVPRLITRLAYPWYPKAAEAWARRHATYANARNVLENPPEGVRIRIFRPNKRLHMDRFTSDTSRLLNAIQAGREEAFCQLRSEDSPAICNSVQVPSVSNSKTEVPTVRVEPDTNLLAAGS